MPTQLHATEESLPRTFRTLHNARKLLGLCQAARLQKAAQPGARSQRIARITLRWEQFRIAYISHQRMHFRKMFFAVAVML